MALHFVSSNQKEHLEIASKLTLTAGWMNDALAIGIYDSVDNNTPTGLRGVFVVQCRDALGAELHAAIAPGRTNTRMVMHSMLRYCFRPNLLDLPMLRLYIPVQNKPAQIAAMQMGFDFCARMPGSIFSDFEVVLMTLKREDCSLVLPAKPTGPVNED